MSHSCNHHGKFRTANRWLNILPQCLYEKHQNVPTIPHHETACLGLPWNIQVGFKGHSNSKDETYPWFLLKIY